MSSLASLARLAFPETSDPSAYVPRAATENAMASIRDWGESDDRGSSLGALIGTPGLGKTQLLRITELRINESVTQFLADGGELAGRARTSRALYLPYAALTPRDLAAWVHGQLKLHFAPHPDLDDAAVAVEALLHLGGGPFDPFFLILDDADAMPSELIDALVTGLPREQSPLRLLIGLNPDSKATRLLAALHALAPTTVEFRARMSVADTAHYVRARMRRVGFPGAEVAKITEAEAKRLNSLSAGIPRRLHELLAARFDGRENASLEFDETELGGEEWMGRPFDDFDDEPGR